MKDRALLLAIDTCGPGNSIALGQQLFGRFQRLGDAEFGGYRSAETLVAETMNLLRMAEVQLAWLNAIVTVNGPGSLTRIRAGLNAVKVLAKENRTPVVTVSRLDVLAAAGGVPCAAFDAHGHKIFLRLAEPSGAARDLLAGAVELASIPPPPRVVLCDESTAQLLKPAWPATELVKVPAPAAADALAFAVARMDSGYGDFVDSVLLEGHPLCHSDGEILGEAASTEPRGE